MEYMRSTPLALHRMLLKDLEDEEDTPQPIHFILAHIARSVEARCYDTAEYRLQCLQRPLSEYLFGYPIPEKTPEQKAAEEKARIDQIKREKLARFGIEWKPNG